MYIRASQVVLVVKNTPSNAGDVRDEGSVPGSGRSPGEGHDNPLQHSCLKKSHGQGSLESYSSRGHKALDTTEAPEKQQQHESQQTGKVRPLPAFIQSLPEIQPRVHLHAVCGCVYITLAELSSYERDLRTYKPKRVLAS